MLTQSLINAAILVYLSVSSGHGINFDFYAGKKAVGKVDEKVVLRENSLSEKLGMETVTRPDQEIVALQFSASKLKSALSLGEQIKKQTPEKPPVASQVNGKFVLILDGDKGIYFDGKYFPSHSNQFSSSLFHEDPPEPVNCVLLSPPERGIDSTDHAEDRNATSKPGEEIVSYPEVFPVEPHSYCFFGSFQH